MRFPSTALLAHMCIYIYIYTHVYIYIYTYTYVYNTYVATHDLDSLSRWEAFGGEPGPFSFAASLTLPRSQKQIGQVYLKRLRFEDLVVRVPNRRAS